MFINTIGDITIYPNLNENIKITISRSKCIYDDINEIMDIKKEDKFFFNVVKISENVETEKVEIIYESTKGYKKLSKIKNKIIILSILEKILKLDICEKYNLYLHPDNIYVKNVNDFKILYRSDKKSLLPCYSFNTLKQYKLLIYSLFTKYTLEEVVKRKDYILYKEKNTFLNKIEKIKDVETIHQEIFNKLNTDQIEYFDDVEKMKKNFLIKNTIRNSICIAICLGLGLVCIVGIMSWKNKYKNNINSEMQNSENIHKAYELYFSGNYEEANKLLAQTNVSDEEIINIYIYTEQYEEILALKGASVEKQIVEYLYSTNKISKILELNENYGTYIYNEKIILSKDRISMDGIKGILSDKKQIIRMAYAYIEMEDFTSVNDISSLYEMDFNNEIDEQKKGTFKNPYSLQQSETTVAPTTTEATVAPTTKATIAPTTTATVAPTTKATIAPTTTAKKGK